MPVTAEQVFALVSYAKTLGVVFLEIEADSVVAQLQLTEALSTVGGGMHGGALMALADIAAAVLASATADGGTASHHGVLHLLPQPRHWHGHRNCHIVARRPESCCRRGRH